MEFDFSCKSRVVWVAMRSVCSVILGFVWFMVAWEQGSLRLFCMKVTHGVYVTGC